MVYKQQFFIRKVFKMAYYYNSTRKGYFEQCLSNVHKDILKVRRYLNLEIAVEKMLSSTQYTKLYFNRIQIVPFEKETCQL